MTNQQPALLPGPPEIVAAWLQANSLRTVAADTLKSEPLQGGHLVTRKRIRHASQSYIVIGDTVLPFNPTHKKPGTAYREAAAIHARQVGTDEPEPAA